MTLQGQTRRLDLSYTFDIDQLPFSFGHSLETTDEGAINYRPLNHVMNILTYCIRDAGKHRFRKIRHFKKSEYKYYYTYVCCQDKNKAAQTVSRGKRDRRRMERYPCKSNLDLKLDLLARRLHVKLQHNYHPEYNDIRLSPEALEYVNTHCADHTPAEIFNNLQSSGISGGSKVAQHQVYYHWQRANSSIWRRDPNQFVSATNLLAEFESKYWHAIYKAGNLRGLAFYIRGTIMALASRAEELVIDATFGTNNSGRSHT